MSAGGSTRLPPLTALKAFEALGRTGSIRAAAQELSVSHTVVSRHVRNLEARLGNKLVVPQGRGLKLTDDGERYHTQVASAFDAIARATRDFAPSRAASLNIWCIPGLAARLILPRLPELEARLPGHHILLNPTLAWPDLANGEADAVIAYLPGAEGTANVRMEVLSEPRVFPVASPTMQARFVNVRTNADLLQMPLLHEESMEQWERWFRSAGLEDLPPLRGPCLWHAHLAIEAARLGQGVAIANEVLVRKEMDSGELVEMVPSDIRLGGYYFGAAQPRWDSHPITCLRNWISELLRHTA